MTNDATGAAAVVSLRDQTGNDEFMDWRESHSLRVGGLVDCSGRSVNARSATWATQQAAGRVQAVAAVGARVVWEARAAAEALRMPRARRAIRQVGIAATTRRGSEHVPLMK